MATFLFDKIIFGPVNSRRLGVSLGINLLPIDVKICSFDCIYCECGRNQKKQFKKPVLPSRIQVKEKLQMILNQMILENKLPNVITFAGNGEPTLHPHFAGIIEDTIQVRDQLTPQTKIAVLSNSSMLHKKDVFGALLKVDENIQKLDSALNGTVTLIDSPGKSFNLDKTIEHLVAFKGKVIIQTLFIRGFYKDTIVDNTSDTEINAWLEAIKRIEPSKVMIYTIERDTPIDTLEKVSKTDLDLIAEKVRAAGFEVQVSS